MFQDRDVGDQVYSLPPLEYLGLVESINGNTHDHYANILRVIPLRDDQCFVVVGSDGKKERHAQSKTELVLIQATDKPSSVAQQATLTLVANAFHFATGRSGVEYKILANSLPVSYVYGDYRLVYPDRTLNGSYICGQINTYLQARAKVLQEISGDDSTSRRIRETMGGQLRQHRSAIKTGVYSKIPVFSWQQSLQFYSEERPLAYGFKSSFLRAVQRKLDIITAHILRKGTVHIDKLVSNLPVSTYERLEYLLGNGLFYPQRIGMAYAWFLREYHKVQAVYKKVMKPIALPFNRQEFDTFANVILDFVNS